MGGWKCGVVVLAADSIWATKARYDRLSAGLARAGRAIVRAEKVSAEQTKQAIEALLPEGWRILPGPQDGIFWPRDAVGDVLFENYTGLGGHPLIGAATLQGLSLDAIKAKIAEMIAVCEKFAQAHSDGFQCGDSSCTCASPWNNMKARAA